MHIRPTLAGFAVLGCLSLQSVGAQEPPARLPAVVINAAPNKPGARKMAGVVRDTIGFPIDGVEVTIPSSHRRTISVGNGAFQFEDIAPGKYEVRVRKFGYAPQVRTIVVDSAGGAGAFAMVPIPASLLPVVSSAVRAPLRSMMALVAKVVPCITIAKSAGARPASRKTARIASMTARSGASGVVSTLLLNRRPPASSATSVKVPPISTPSLAAATPSLPRPQRGQQFGVPAGDVNRMNPSSVARRSARAAMVAMRGIIHAGLDRWRWAGILPPIQRGESDGGRGGDRSAP